MGASRMEGDGRGSSRTRCRQRSGLRPLVMLALCCAEAMRASAALAQEVSLGARSPAPPAYALDMPLIAGVAALLAIAGTIAVLLLRSRGAGPGGQPPVAPSFGHWTMDVEQVLRRADEREAHLRAVLDNMVEGVVTIDAARRICSVNREAENLFGYTALELVGRDVTTLLSPVEGGILPQPLGDRAPTLGVDLAGLALEVRGMTRSGAQVPLELSVSGMARAGEQQYILILRDLGPRKRALEKISEAETRLLNAINALPDGFVLYDRDDRLVICNDKYREIYKASGDVIRVGEKFENMLRAGVANGQYAEAIGREEEWLAERLRRHNEASGVVEQHLGDGRWLRIFEQRTPDGGVVGFRVDITELKQREAALQRSENMLRATVLGAFDAIIVTDETTKIIAFNPAAEAIFGYTAEEACGHGVYDLLIPEPMCSRYKAGLAEYLRTGHGPLLGKRREEVCLRKDGSEVLVEVAVNASGAAGEQLFIANVRDIEEEKAKALALEDARDKAEAASRAKASFLAMMSHEIRTPLNGVLGLLDLLAGTGLSPKQSGYVRTARESGTALLSILNDVLVFSKLEAGKLDLEPAPESLYRLLSAIRDLMAPPAVERGLTLRLRVADSAPDTVIVDGGRLRQVLLNLVGNALKFTEAGEVSIELSGAPAREGDAEGTRRVRFAVSDTGIGIPAEKIPDLFAEFSTLDASYSRRYDGTGLGLAISRELVEKMGGSIEVESTVGEGSTFRFELPLAVAEDVRAPAAGGAGDAAVLASLQGARVLLAEDNATNRMVLSEMLGNAGCIVTFAVTGREAVDRAAAADFDIVLMDISMPEMDGVEATRCIRAMDGPRARVPIVALTAHALDEDRDRALSNGMDAFVSKPVSRPELVGTVATMLSSADRPALAIRPPDARVQHEAVMDGATGDPVAGPHAGGSEDTMDEDATAAPLTAARDGPAEAPDAGPTAPVAPPRASTVGTIGGVDPEILSALIGDLPDEMLARVIVQFRADVTRRLDEIRRGMAEGDGEAVGAATHVLTSVLGTFGAMAASELSSDINQQLRTGARTDELGMVSELLEQAERAVVAVLDLLDMNEPDRPREMAEVGER